VHRVRLGIVGLGAIAQAIHLPNLARLWDRFEIVFVCDLDPGLAEQIASSLGSAVRSTSDPQTVCDADLDAILILSSGPHAPLIRGALEAGKHVFVEKPLCLTLAEASRLGDVARSAERVLQIGYMKLFDPMAMMAATEARSIVDPRLLRITVLHPSEASQQQHLSIRRSSIPAVALDAGRAYETEMTTTAIGDLPPRFGCLYREVALGSMIHQVALARRLVGRLPHEVTAAVAWPIDGNAPEEIAGQPPTVVAIADFGPGFRLVLDWVWLPGNLDYFERYELFAPDSRLSLDMPTPYALDQRSVLRVERSIRTNRSATRTVSDHRGGFQAELEAFHDAIVGGPPYPSDADEAAEDTRFLQRLVAHLAESQGFAAGGEAATA
jgi:predicted dehydrogenase